MRIRTIGAAVAVLGLVVTLAARAADAPAAPDAATTAELAKLAGTWQAVAGSRGGKPAPADDLKSTQMVFEGQKITLKDGARDKEGLITRLDPSKSPAEMDFVPAEKGVPVKGESGMKVVYKVDGDSLTVVFSRGGERPTSLAAGDKVAVLELKKQK